MRMPMRKLLLPLMFALALPAASAMAAPQEAWRVDGDKARVTAAGIMVPTAAGTLNLIKSGELSDGGKGIDNVAQYMSEDGAVQATAYIYLTSYADTAIAAYMTDKAIVGHFGPETRRIAFGVAPVGGVADGAIRSIYAGAADGQLTTAAALVHAGRWIVKLRVTGPADRADEVTAGIDAMLAGMTFDAGVAVHAAQAAAIAPCSARQRGAAAGAAANFPRDGRDALCIDRTIRTADSAYEVLRPVGGAGSFIVPMDDAGRTMRFTRSGDDAGYQMAVHSVGRLDLYDVYAEVPGDRKLAAMIDGADSGAAKPTSSTAYAANGMVTVATARGAH